MLPVATAIQRGASKINACVLCVHVLCKTRRSFIRRFSRLSEDAFYLRTGVNGFSKIRRILAKPRLILDVMCGLYGKFSSYFSSYKWPKWVLSQLKMLGPLCDQTDKRYSFVKHNEDY